MSKNYYDAISTFKINIPTPIMAGVRTPLKQFASCVSLTQMILLPYLLSDHAIGKYVRQRLELESMQDESEDLVQRFVVEKFNTLELFHSLKSSNQQFVVVHKTESEVEVQPFISQSGTKKSK